MCEAPTISHARIRQAARLRPARREACEPGSTFDSSRRISRISCSVAELTPDIASPAIRFTVARQATGVHHALSQIPETLTTPDRCGLAPIDVRSIAELPETVGTPTVGGAGIR